jgi:hypothetical protein
MALHQITGVAAGAPVGPIWRRGRRVDTYARALGGGLHANVVDGTLVGFGLEPIDGPVIGADHPGRRRVVVAWAAPIAGVAAGAVATTFVLRHRHAA